MSYSFKITQDDNDRRLDRTLRSIFKWVTLGEIMKSIRKGEVRINSKRIHDPGVHIYEGDELTVKWPLKNENTDERLTKFTSLGKIKIIYQGQNVLILNKPSGILVQPDEAGGDSVISRVWGFMKSKTPAAVHRLDRNTTGVLAVALHGDSLRELEKLFKERKIRKIYRAIVTGRVNDSDEIIIDAPLLKDAENNIVKVSDDGLTAITKCKCLKISKDGKFSFVEIELLTGRTHQARVHMSHIKHPILGDKKYGDFKVNKLMKNITRPLLHAYELDFPDNLNEALNEIAGKKFFAEIPDDMKNFLESRF
ncbi:MAG: RluA family pseudouridine synthase [Synergistaceae bacterium]|nr:RluA family pseudouridine synthase [Synergistaceae bacterium]MBQ6739002.1 RluA family pseudouridine synthase [Synergistaceae bacterium]MBR0074484.1 RluA family pseudouridine synthase [Synergistaceae bacterium]MBR0080662.1 RluA family pseudouridine synthase [Synergistaceae bacterium]MBR0233275.1 RluA family pseudouridine synthase [Synergistaceae bacterium]